MRSRDYVLAVRRKRNRCETTFVSPEWPSHYLLCQILTVSSEDPETMRLPSGENATDVTLSWGPLNGPPRLIQPSVGVSTSRRWGPALRRDCGGTCTAPCGNTKRVLLGKCQSAIWFTVVLFLPRPSNRVRKCLCKVRSSNYRRVQSTRRSRSQGGTGPRIPDGVPVS